jgi:hypothetical protein
MVVVAPAADRRCLALPGALTFSVVILISWQETNQPRDVSDQNIHNA